MQIAATGNVLLRPHCSYWPSSITCKLAVADTDLRAPRRMVRGWAIHAFAVRRKLRAFGKWALACS